MKYRLLTACILIGMSFNLSAQESVFSEFDQYHKYIYGSILGSDIFFVEANYDVRMQRGRTDGMGFRLGIGGGSLPIIRESGTDTRYVTLTFPVEINYILGAKSNSFIVGMGALPMYTNPQNRVVVDSHRYIIFNDGLALAAFLDIGYRFRPLKNNFTIQVNWNPMYSNETFAPNWIAISLGVRLNQPRVLHLSKKTN